VRPAAPLWRAVSHPAAFFAGLEDEPRLGRAAARAAASAAVGSLVAGLLALRASGSDAWLLFLLGGPVLVLPYLAIVALLGGLVLMRPAGLDLRAFEVVAWAWTPSGVLAVSLLPIGLVAPAATLAGGLAMLPAWHLWLVWRGVQTFAVAGARAAFALYAAAVFGLPLALLAFTVTVLSRLA
jgi:hypothetical protein